MRLPYTLADHDPNIIHDRMVALGREWANADGDARHLENCEASVYSMVFLHVEGRTVEERKAMAKSHPDYVAHLDRMTDARTKANLAKVEYEGAKAWIDVARSIEASQRAGMR